MQRYAFLKDIEDLEYVKDEDILKLTNFLQTYLKLEQVERLKIMKVIALFYQENLQIIYDSIMTPNYDNYPSTKTNEAKKEEVEKK